MARPERKTVDYFPHSIGDGKKMFFIEQKYGNDGYATWFKILESLASTDDHFLNLSNQIDVLFLSAKCRVDKDVLLSILDDLSMLGEIDDFLWKNSIVYSHKFIESIQDAYARRTNKCMDYESFCIHYDSLCTTVTRLEYDKSNINPQSKVKKSKEKQSTLSDEKQTGEFLSWFNQMCFDANGKTGKFLSLSRTDLNNLKKLRSAGYGFGDFKKAFSSMMKNPWVIENKTGTPAHFLRNENFQKYVNTFEEEPKFDPYG